MTRKMLITVAIAQAVSYIAPGGLIVIAAFRLMPFKPHGRISILLTGIILWILLALFHHWQWRGIRRRLRAERAWRAAFERTE